MSQLYCIHIYDFYLLISYGVMYLPCSVDQLYTYLLGCMGEG